MIDEKAPHIIIIGNPRDGFQFIGPFATIHKASQYLTADDPRLGYGDCWAAPLYPAEPNKRNAR